MLVLTRKEDQKVFIPGLDISIKVIRCKNSAVTLGFDAPPEIRIMRNEIDQGVSVSDPEALGRFLESKLKAFPSASQHDVRDQFNVVAMTLQMLADEIETGVLQDIDGVFDSICKRLQGLKATKNDEDAFVLVVEDEANERELLAGILRMSGYRVATASDGNEALKYIREHGAPAFVLVDMQMPVCDGAELVREIRGLPELDDVRVYVVSGSEEGDCDVAPDAIDGWYTKPLAPQQLINEMAKE